MALKKERGSNKKKGLCKLAIDEELTIFSIEVLKKGLVEEIDTYDQFELNLSEVEEIDTAGIQLLLAFNSELIRRKKMLKLTTMNSVVRKLMESYAVTQRFKTGESA